MRVGIVNDTRSVVELLKKLVQDSKHRVAWVAYDGKEALELCSKDKPDVILMDLIMPAMNGVETTKAIMEKNPTAILVVTSSVSLNFSMACEAMSLGAIDAVEVPSLAGANSKMLRDDFITKIEKVEKISSRLDAAKLHLPESLSSKSIAISGNSPTAEKKLIAAIGSSTGGPAILGQILSQLPAELKATVLIAQHIGKTFMPDLVSWLKRSCAMPIRIIKEGEKPISGTVMVTEGDSHLLINRDGSFHYEHDVTNHSYKPSIDLLFESLALCNRFQGVATILTGIGKDGSQGLLSLRKKGWFTIAQSPDTCVAKGMPQSAIDLGATQAVGNGLEIGELIRVKIQSFKDN